jgi:hypothetical protein
MGRSGPGKEILVMNPAAPTPEPCTLDEEIQAYAHELPLFEPQASRICVDTMIDSPARERAYYILTRELDGLSFGAPEEGVAVWNPFDFGCAMLGRMLFWYFDLPASQADHHSRRFGHFDHSLEVALGALVRFRELIGACESCQPWIACPTEHLARVQVALALVHDCNKARSLVQVKSPATGELWDPRREPLLLFKNRHKLPILEPTPFEFIPNPGAGSNESQDRDLIPFLIDPRFRAELTLPVLSAFDYYTRGTGRNAPAVCMEEILADHVRQADGESSRNAVDAKPADGESLQKKLEQATWLFASVRAKLGKYPTCVELSRRTGRNVLRAIQGRLDAYKAIIAAQSEFSGDDGLYGRFRTLQVKSPKTRGRKG